MGRGKTAQCPREYRKLRPVETACGALGSAVLSSSDWSSLLGGRDDPRHCWRRGGWGAEPRLGNQARCKRLTFGWHWAAATKECRTQVRMKINLC